ncbi:hypothetical protein F5Y08DRAFT_307485 [Xylaria arbuscula]|nr:hypothetical protein F5Y08DRAFT_307485 [Xylaria arbuscula]
MNCACRTTSLRIFVQSLTEVRVTDPIISRSIRLNRLGSPNALRQAPIRHPSRLFGSSTTTYSSSTPRHDNIIESPPVDEYVGEQSHAPTHTAAESTANNVPPPPVHSASPASGNDFNTAKLKGAILDFSPESIDSLVANLGQTSITGQEGALPPPNNFNIGPQSTLSPRPKSPVQTSQLKRRKILKEDKPQSNADETQPTRREEWQIQKQALKEKFPEGWRPRKRLSPDALDGIRALHSQFPEQYTTEVLARNFEVSVEAIRRILRSKWTPSPEEEASRQERWFNRGKNIWSQMAELGKKPPRRWREEGVVRKPHWNEKKGPRNEYPYKPDQEARAEYEEPAESAQRKLSGRLL